MKLGKSPGPTDPKSPQRVKVCLVSPLPPPMGGIARWTSKILERSQADSSVELRVIDSALRGRSVHQLSVARRAYAGARQLLSCITKLTCALVTDRPHVVHINTSGQLGLIRDVVLLSLTRIFRVPAVFHIRFGRVPKMAQSESREWRLMKVALRLCKASIVLDTQTGRVIQDVRPGLDVRLIPNFIDTSELSGGIPSDAAPELKGPSTERTVVFVGWVSESKGIRELLNSWSLVAQQGWELQIIGPFDVQYVNRVQSEIAFNSVEFTGGLEHTETLARIRDCGIFVLPSHTEGFPNAILEAMALGKPIIATNVGAIPEMLADSAGIVVNAKEVTELAEALSELMNDSDLRKTLGKNALDRVNRQYEFSKVMTMYKDIWRSMV